MLFRSLLEQTQHLLSQVNESQRVAAATMNSLEAVKTENAELRSRLERLESLLRNVKVKLE